MPFSERGPLGSSDDPITKPQKEWVPEAKSNMLSPEDQAALRELLAHWEQAKKTNDTEKISKTADDINELLERRLNDEDLTALGEAMFEPEGEEEDIPVEEITKPAKITSEKGEAEKSISETAGREKNRYGTNLPLQITSERRRGLEEGGSSDKTKVKFHRHLRKVAGKRGDSGKKPIWKGRRSQKRKTKMAA
jgi:hypothetical protein